MSYDIIGDIHGCSHTLRALLEALGYDLQDGTYRHHTRQAIFLGDFVDRGSHQREVLNIVRPMIDGAAAQAVMGNHEFNAIAYATPRPHEGYLREHSDKNRKQHRTFLDAFEHSEDYQETIDWFARLPLWLDLGELRIVHACWHRGLLNSLETHYEGNRLTDALLQAATTAGNWEFKAIETLLKGKEIPLPAGQSFADKDGTIRQEIRVRWWDQGATTYRDAFLGSEAASTHIPDDDIDGDHLVEYSHDDPPVFLGHYWLEGEAAPLGRNIACVDYSVAKPGGKLAAYRWDGEQSLEANKFLCVARQAGD